MPVKPETRFYRRVNAEIPLDIHRQKRESSALNGTPDFWYSGFKADAWVEYKWIPKLSRNGVDPVKLLSALQRLWINCRWREGRTVFVVIGSPEGCVVLQNGSWNEHVPAAFFRLSVSEVSAFLTEILHDPSAVTQSRSLGDQFDLPNPHDLFTDRGDEL